MGETQEYLDANAEGSEQADFTDFDMMADRINDPEPRRRRRPGAKRKHKSRLRRTTAKGRKHTAKAKRKGR